MRADARGLTDKVWMAVDLGRGQRCLCGELLEVTGSKAEKVAGEVNRLVEA